MKRIKDLETILVLSGAVMIFYFIFSIRMLLYISLALILIGVFSKYLSAQISFAWLKLARILGVVSSTLLLSLIFFVFLFPIALLYRLKNKDPLMLRKKETGSYFIARNHVYTDADLENIW